jgi:hypothetical protein
MDQPDISLSPRTTVETCATCGSAGISDRSVTAAPSFIFALGRIEARFPSLDVEKEFAQATGRADTAGLADRQAFHSVLTDRANRYLARQLCWVLTIEGLETYILIPRDPQDFDLLLEAIQPVPNAVDVDVVVGERGAFAPPGLCHELMVPVIIFDQVYSFPQEEFVKAIPRPEKMDAEQFEPAARDLFDRLMQIADNAGATDEHRALNYLAVRYPAIYATTTDYHGRSFSLTGVEVRPSRLSGVRKVVDVIFAYTHRQADFTEKQFVRVDVTGKWPFLVTRMSPYYER